MNVAPAPAPQLIIAKEIPRDLPLPGALTAPAKPAAPAKLILPSRFSQPTTAAPQAPGAWVQRAGGLVIPGGLVTARAGSDLVAVNQPLNKVDIVGVARAAGATRAQQMGPAAAQILTGGELRIAKTAAADIAHDRLIALLREGQVKAALAQLKR